VKNVFVEYDAMAESIGYIYKVYMNYLPTASMIPPPFVVLFNYFVNSVAKNKKYQVYSFTVYLNKK
jgi:hypothetical protein